MPALLAVAAGVLTLVTALKSVRWCGIAATAGAVGAMISWLLIPPQSLMMSTHLTYRSFFGLNLVPLVENLPFLFPFYRLVFLTGCVLLAVMLVQRLRARSRTADERETAVI